MSKRRASAGAVVATAVGLLFSVSAPAALPTLTLEATDAVVGGTVHATAELTESPGAGGEISFEVFASDDPTCIGTALEQSSVTVEGEGEYASEDFEPIVAGDYYWTARYSGDEANEPAESACAATSTVSKASPELTGNATSGAVGSAIRDEVTLTGGFSAGGEVTFAVYGPGDAGCATPLDTSTGTLSSDEAASEDFVSQAAGAFRWSASYAGDANNEPFDLECEAAGQTSSVEKAAPNLAAAATSTAVVGNTISSQATLSGGFSPGGQIVFRAFSPGDTDCSGAAAFSSTAGVAGNGSYRSGAFSPARVGSFRWTVAYSGDPNNAPATVGCGKATSAISQARPTIAGAVPQRVPVGTAFRDAATLQGGFKPGGTVTFRIFGPVAAGCGGPAYVNTVAVRDNGSFASDPFVPLRTGRYSFAISYSGDAENQAASEPCDSPGQVVQVVKRSPKVKPRAVLLGAGQISIRARLSGSVSPSGRITFRLFGPDDGRCRRKPEFSGGISVKSNGTFPLARYLATKPGVYRLSVGYSGDQRNRRFSGSCGGAQPIRVR